MLFLAIDISRPVDGIVSMVGTVVASIQVGAVGVEHAVDKLHGPDAPGSEDLAGTLSMRHIVPGIAAEQGAFSPACQFHQVARFVSVKCERFLHERMDSGLQAVPRN